MLPCMLLILKFAELKKSGNLRGKADGIWMAVCGGWTIAYGVRLLMNNGRSHDVGR